MSTDKSLSLPVGTVLAGNEYHYKILKVLGNGSFGITYLSEILLLGKLGTVNIRGYVAIKEFFMKDINERNGTEVSLGSGSTLFADYLGKFRKEAVNLSQMNHPGIVEVLESFDANNTSYIVMEYLDGGSLDERISKKGGQIEESMIYIKAVCQAVAYMHSKKTLHLDLKPSNIMLDKQGHVKLIDFGLSKHYNEYGEPESTTTIGMGTKGYAPLEQSAYKGDGKFQATLDIYALGATLFKMLTGKTPPTAPEVLNDSTLLRNLLVKAGVTESLILCIEKAMAPKNVQRYQSVNALLAALDSHEDEVYDDDENTDVVEDTEFESMPKNNLAEQKSDKGMEKNRKSYLIPVLISIIVFIILSVCIRDWKNDTETTTAASVVQDSIPSVLVSENFTKVSNDIHVTTDTKNYTPKDDGKIAQENRIKFAKNAIKMRFIDHDMTWSGYDLDDYLQYLLSKWERDANELYGTGDNIFNDGIWHIGNDRWEERLEFEQEDVIEKRLNGQWIEMYYIRFELFYGDEKQGYKDIIIYPCDNYHNEFKIYDIKTDNAINGYWTRQELKKHYRIELENEGMYLD